MTSDSPSQPQINEQLNPYRNTESLSPTGGLAILSDIHANIDALGAVLTDLAVQRCFSIFCLADTIGYGPEPAACVKTMRDFAPINLMGNHEAMYLATKPKGKKRLGPAELGDLWPPLELCHRQIGATEAKWISELPLVVPVAAMALVHASQHEPPAFGYISNQTSAQEHFARQTTRLGFYGHTHVPALWQEKGKKSTCYTPGEDPITLDPDCRYAIGVGSVGQPRDDDPRACYVIYQAGSGSHHLPPRALRHRKSPGPLQKSRTFKIRCRAHRPGPVTPLPLRAATADLVTLFLLRDAAGNFVFDQQRMACLQRDG